MRTHSRASWPLCCTCRTSTRAGLNGRCNGDAKGSPTIKGKSTARGIKASSPQPGSKREDYQESGGQWALAEHKK